MIRKKMLLFASAAVWLLTFAACEIGDHTLQADPVPCSQNVAGQAWSHGEGFNDNGDDYTCGKCASRNRRNASYNWYDYVPNWFHEAGKNHLYWCAGVAGDYILYSGNSANPLRSDDWPDGIGVFGPDSSGFDATHTCDPNVIKVGSTYLLYYGGWDGSSAGAAIGLAWGNSPTSFPNRYPDPIVSSEGSGLYGAGQPSVVIIGPYYLMSYHDSNGLDGVGSYMKASTRHDFLESEGATNWGLKRVPGWNTKWTFSSTSNHRAKAWDSNGSGVLVDLVSVDIAYAPDYLKGSDGFGALFMAANNNSGYDKTSIYIYDIYVSGGDVFLELKCDWYSWQLDGTAWNNDVRQAFPGTTPTGWTDGPGILTDAFGHIPKEWGPWGPELYLTTGYGVIAPYGNPTWTWDVYTGWVRLWQGPW